MPLAGVLARTVLTRWLGWGHSDNKGTHHKVGVFLHNCISSKSKDKPMCEIWKSQKLYSFVFG